MTSTKQGIVFDVETGRILEILSREIYDSPYAMLRENVQNAYDAILMRRAASGGEFAQGRITIELTQHRVVVRDNGIGMTEEVLRTNFWKAGSSGKRTTLARNAGVVGTFGIGAMANFGVCEKLSVETRHLSSSVTLISTAERSSLSIAKECIVLQEIEDDREVGTTIIADLTAKASITPSQARAYLEPYVRFLPVIVEMNGEILSGNAFGGPDLQTLTRLNAATVTAGSLSFEVTVFVDSSGKVHARVGGVVVAGEQVMGDAMLIQAGGQLMAYRNYFGLAPAPVSGHYLFGGFANLGFLEPTAGREALSRESISQLQQVISLVEKEASEALAKIDAADQNTSFQHYVVSNGRYDLATHVTVEVLPLGEQVKLGNLATHVATRTSYYYVGHDQSILRTFGTEGDTYLIHCSQANPRRQVQLGYLGRYLPKIEQVADRPTVIKRFGGVELSLEEAALSVRTGTILAEDYVLPNHDIVWAQISHGIPLLVEKDGDVVRINLARDTPLVRPVLETYRTARDVFGGFVRDFVRAQLYPHIAAYVPSATREGAEALRRALERNRELYKYDETDLGSLETILADYLAGEVDFRDVLESARSATRPQTQSVAPNQVGEMEQILPDVVESPAEPAADGSEEGYDARPSIVRDDIVAGMKLLTVNRKHPQLNGFQLFLALSDRLFKVEGDFFRAPHRTRLIWGGHRVIFIFSHASDLLTLYYDVEFKQPLPEQVAGGAVYPTTTIFTKDRIFVPIPELLMEAFRPVDGRKEFFVRYDTIGG